MPERHFRLIENASLTIPVSRSQALSRTENAPACASPAVPGAPVVLRRKRPTKGDKLRAAAAAQAAQTPADQKKALKACSVGIRKWARVANTRQAHRRLLRPRLSSARPAVPALQGRGFALPGLASGEFPHNGAPPRPPRCADQAGQGRQCATAASSLVRPNRQSKSRSRQSSGPAGQRALECICGFRV